MRRRYAITCTGCNKKIGWVRLGMNKIHMAHTCKKEEDALLKYLKFIWRDL